MTITIIIDFMIIIVDFMIDVMIDFIMIFKILNNIIIFFLMIILTLIIYCHIHIFMINIFISSIILSEYSKSSILISLHPIHIHLLRYAFIIYLDHILYMLRFFFETKLNALLPATLISAFNTV